MKEAPMLVSTLMNLHVHEVRGSGCSTAQALGILSAAIANPGREVAIKDHFGGYHADCNLAQYIRRIAADLNLVGIAFSGPRGQDQTLTVCSAPRGITESAYVKR